jgi:hypothetical protein
MDISIFMSLYLPNSMKPRPHDAVVPKRRLFPSNWGINIMIASLSGIEEMTPWID